MKGPHLHLCPRRGVLHFLLLFCSLGMMLPGMGQESSPIPDWIKDDWAFRAAEGGIWIAGNEAYQSEQEPYDAYGIHWYYGLGKNSFKGQLYGITSGEKSGVFWEFFEYWDPATKTWVLTQINGSGMVGVGSQRLDSLNRFVSVQHFADLRGVQFDAGHKAWVEGDSLHTKSYDIIDGQWKDRRYYLWKRAVPAKEEIPDYWEGIDFLMGEWEVDLGTPGIAKMIFSWGENKRLIHYKSLHPAPRGRPNSTEAEGIIIYDGVDKTWRFTNSYVQSDDQLISNGTYTILDNGVVERKFTCRYGEGATLPWSNGIKAPEGGTDIVFRQLWTIIDENTLEGRFYRLKDGAWISPDPAKEGVVYRWTKVQK